MRYLVCTHCNDDSYIYMSRISHWDKLKGEWVEDPHGDEFYCNACGYDDIEEIHEEIQEDTFNETY